MEIVKSAPLCVKIMGWKKSEDSIKLLQVEPTTDYGTLNGASSKKWKKEDKLPQINFLYMFKYATRLDVILMFIGGFFAFFSGACLPILGLFFGGMTNIFINQAVNGLLSDENATRLLHEAMNKAVPTKIVFDERKPEPFFAPQGQGIGFEMVYNLKEFFFFDLTNHGTKENNTMEPLTESEFSNTLNQYLTIYLVMGTLILISSFIQTMCWEYTSEHQVHTIRKVYFSQIIRQDITWYDKNEDGNLPNKLSDDLERIREGTGHKFVMIIQYLSTFISGIAVGLYVNSQLTMITLCVGPFLIALSAYGSTFAAKHVVREQQKYAKAGAVAEETLSNIKTVSAYSGQPIEISRYHEALEEGRLFAMSRYNLLSICLGCTFILMYGSYCLGFWYGSQMVEAGTATPGSVFTVFFSVVVGAFSIGHALPFVNIVAATVGVMASIEEIISRKVTIDPYSPSGRKPARIEGRVEFKNVHFSYPSRPSVKILNGLNLSIEPGKTTAIVGSSGAGKSTIVSLIQRFYDPTSGEICLDDYPLTELNVKWLRGKIGLVSQEPVLFGVSIAENISYGRQDVSQAEIEEAATLANAHDFITTLPAGYETLVGDTGSQLSGGQKQRIAIARALIRDPKILLLDEATSALDAHSEGIVQDTLTKVMKGRTTIVVAHRLSTIKNADIIYVMQNGTLFESGTHDELMERGSLYYNLVISQMAMFKESTSTSETERSSVTSPHESEGTNSDDDSENRGDVSQQEALESIEEKGENEDSEENAQRKRKRSKTVGQKFTKRIVKNENGEEIEEITVVTKTIRKEISRTDIQKQTHTEDNNAALDGETEKSKKEDDIPMIYTRRKRGSSVREITNEERKNMPLAVPEPIEKDVSIVEILKMQKPEWHWLLLGFIGSAGAGLVTPLFALFYGEIFHVFTLTGDEFDYAYVFWTRMLAGLAAFCGVAYTAQCKGITESSEKLIARARAQVFENILRQPVGWFDLETSTPGVLVNRLARNIPLIKAAAGLRTGQVISSLVTLTGSFTIAFVCGWKLAIILVICVPIIIYASYKQSVLLKKNQMRDALSMDNAGRVASETVRNIRTVQSLGQEKLFSEIYAYQLEAPYKESKKQAFLYSLMYSVMQGVVFYMYAIAFRVGGYLVQSHEMETSSIYKVFFALSLCAASVGQSFMYLQDWNKARHATKILYALLSRKSEIDPFSPYGAKPDIKGDVEFKNVHFVYPTRPNVRVLRGISFKVEAGKTLAFVGESGCGKSTVISLLERFYDPIGGVIMIDGYDIRTCNLNYIRSKIGIVNQEPILFDCSIRDNIAYGAVALEQEVTFERITEVAKIANVHDFVMNLPQRYDTMVGERGIQLSGGQKQRVAIARALIRDPKILLLDEATSALDSENEKIVQTALDRAKEGRTCIVVAHRLSTIQNADQICVVSRGKIVEMGTHEQLIELKGLYHELTQRQVL